MDAELFGEVRFDASADRVVAGDVAAEGFADCFRFLFVEPGVGERDEVGRRHGAILFARWVAGRRREFAAARRL
jgi:hypothetical protein